MLAPILLARTTQKLGKTTKVDVITYHTSDMDRDKYKLPAAITPGCLLTSYNPMPSVTSANNYSTFSCETIWLNWLFIRMELVEIHNIKAVLVLVIDTFY